MSLLWAVFLQAAAPQAPAGETICKWLIQAPGEAVSTVDAAGVRVLAQTALPGAFSPSRPPNAVGLQCGRTSIVPGEHDDEVIALGMPFAIADVGGEETRVGVLEVSNGVYRFRNLTGVLKEGEAQAIEARLRAFQARLARSE